MPRTLSLVQALCSGWSYGSIDHAVRMRFVELFRKSGKLFLRLVRDV